MLRSVFGLPRLLLRRVRSFYEDLPDLLNTVPPNLLGLTEEQAEQLREEERAIQRDRAAGIATAEDDPEGPGEEGVDAGEGEGQEDDADRIAEELKGLSVGDGVEEEEDGEEGDSEDEVRVSFCTSWASLEAEYLTALKTLPAVYGVFELKF